MWTARDEAKQHDAVIFDFRGVLYRKTESDRDAFFDYMEEELGISRHDLRSRLPGVEGKLKPRVVVEVLETSIDNPAIHEKLRCAPGLRRSIPLEENIALVRPLARQYRLGLLANSDGSVEERLAGLGLRCYFNSIIDSHVVGIRKPDPAVYLLACRDLDVEPERCVFIDDRIVNVEAARSLGMTAIHYRWEQGDVLASQLRLVGVPVPLARRELIRAG